MTTWLTTCVKADNGLYSLAKTGALKLTAAFVYEVTGRRIESWAICSIFYRLFMLLLHC